MRVLNDGTYYELPDKLKRVSLLIMDDAHKDGRRGRPVLEIMEAREPSRGPRRLTAQAERMADAHRGRAMADSILGRIATDATRIDIESPNMREYFARQKTEGNQRG